MIEFYHKHFKSSYKTKVSQLIKDIDALLSIEKIPLNDAKAKEKVRKFDWIDTSKIR